MRRDQRFPTSVLVGHRTQDQHLGCAARDPLSAQPGGDDLRVVGDQQVAGAQLGAELAEDAVAQVRSPRTRASAVEHQQARRIARLNRDLGDGALRQRVVEVTHPQPGRAARIGHFGRRKA
jgi:hypothetical protein